MFNLNNAILDWKKSLYKNPSLEDGYIQELESHIRDKIEDYINKGISEKEAFEKAKEEIGGARKIGAEFFKTDTKNMVTGRPSWQTPRWVPVLFWNYFKTSMRYFRKEKLYTFINVLGLAIGITAAAFIAMYVFNQLSFDTFHENADRIYRVTYKLQTTTAKFHFARTAPLYGPTLKNDFSQVKYFTRIHIADQLIKYKGQFFDTDHFYYTDKDAFNIFGYKMLNGNPNTVLTNPLSITMGKSEAQKLFGNADPIGKTIYLADTLAYTVTGIFEDAPENSHFKPKYLATYPDPSNKWMNGWGNNTYYTYVKLNSDKAISSLKSGMPQFINKYLTPGLDEGEKLDVVFQPVEDIHLYSNATGDIEPGGNITYVKILIFAALFILLIAGINFVNLTLARSAGRAKEIAMRKIVGAEKRNLIYQFVGESILLTSVASIIAIGFISTGLPYFNNLTGTNVQFNAENIFLLLPVILSFTLIIGTVSGLYPALVISSLNVVKIFASKSSTSHGGSHIFRRILITAQFVVSLTLITGTIIFSSQLDFIQKKDLGFNKDQVLVIPFGSYYNDVIENYNALRNSLLSNPGISRVTMSGDIPGNMNTSLSYYAEGMPANSSDAITAMIVEPDFLKTYNMKIVAGRDFSSNIKSDYDNAMIINESAVKSIGWSSPKEAIGKRFDMIKNGKIIGVVKDFNYYSLHKKIEPVALTYWPDWFGMMSIKMNTKNLSETLAGIKKVWDKVLPGRPFNYSFFDQDFNKQYNSDQLFQKVFLTFAILTIFIACLGIFGLVSFSAERRTKEIGIRKVLGAGEGKLIYLLVKEFMLLVIIANVVAFPVSYLISTNWLNNFAYRISISGDAFILAGIISLSISLLTAGFQAYNSTRKNPVDILRSE